VFYALIESVQLLLFLFSGIIQVNTILFIEDHTTMATIYDVAKVAGVSISTVSNYLNNKYISPEKRAVIQKAIEQLSYVPSQSAKRLKTKKSNQIAVILPNVDERIYSKALMGISLSLEKSQLITVLYMTDDKQASEEKAINECLTSEYAGIIICTCKAFVEH